MELPKLKDLVKDKKVFFHFYREGELWYITEDGFEFPIPPDDMRGAIFRREDKAIIFMRFIRKHLTWLKECIDETTKGITGGQASTQTVQEQYCQETKTPGSSV